MTAGPSRAARPRRRPAAAMPPPRWTWPVPRSPACPGAIRAVRAMI